MRNFKHGDVIKIFPDLKPRTLISWSEKGLFEPVVLPQGPGSRREYSERNLIEIGIIRVLISYRFPHSIVKPLMQYLRQHELWQSREYDIVIALRRQYVSGSDLSDPSLGYIEDYRIAKRTDFGKVATELVFLERYEEASEFAKYGLSKVHIAVPGVASAIVISVLGIWEVLRENPIFLKKR